MEIIKISPRLIKFFFNGDYEKIYEKYSSAISIEEYKKIYKKIYDKIGGKSIDKIKNITYDISLRNEIYGILNLAPYIFEKRIDKDEWKKLKAWVDKFPR